VKISYNGLWKLLIDNGMQKKDLIDKIGVSSTTIAKMGKGEKVSKVRCLKCNNIWVTTAGSLLRKDRKRSADNNGCPKCAKSKMGTPRKKVLNVETGEIFDSAIEAGKKYNTVPSAIRQCCRGVSSMSKGFHWRYVEEKIQ
jgi:hypothetical protein